MIRMLNLLSNRFNVRNIFGENRPAYVEITLFCIMFFNGGKTLNSACKDPDFKVFNQHKLVEKIFLLLIGQSPFVVV